MAFTYCPSCGYKNLHGVKPPQFCGGCGKAFHEGVARRTKITLTRSSLERKRGVEPEEIDDDEISSVNSVPHIDNLKYTVSEGDMGSRKMNLKDLTGDISEEHLKETQSAERGATKRKRGRPRGSKNSTNGKRRNRRK